MKLKSIIATIASASVLSTGAIAQDKIVIKGSDTLGAKLVPQLAEAYKKAGSTANFEIAAEGSSQAFTALLGGAADIGMSSRDVKDTEVAKFTAKGQKLKEHVAAYDMIAVIVNKRNPVKKLTLKQIEGIFTGKITDWSQVGGKPGKISAYTRNTTSGTYKTFQELAMAKKDYGSKTQKMAGNEQIAQEVGNNARGIGYVGLAYTKADGVATLAVEGVPCIPANKAKYPLARKLYYYTIGTPTGEAAKFLKWAISSTDAQDIVERVGFVRLK